MRTVLSTVAAFVVLAQAQPASAWGANGHRIVNAAAMSALPASLPAFLRSPDAIAEIAALGPEPDRLKNAGEPRDADIDPAHFLDLDDDGTVAGVVSLAALPGSREAYDAIVRTGHASERRVPDQYAVGYLPYEIADGWERIAKDFALWRVDRYGETHAADAGGRARFGADRRLREILVLRDIGTWGHFVADGSQPLHVSVHYNGWGDGPNPNGFTQAHTIHAYFETTFVDAHASLASVLPRVGPYVPGDPAILTRVGAYLLATNGHVADVYRLDASGALANARPEAVSFVLDRLADGARTMRDLIADAFAASESLKTGYPGVLVRDVEAGRVTLTPESAGLGGG